MERRRLVLSFIGSLAIAVFYAQNLVPNPSFESFTTCPNLNVDIHKAAPWNQPPGHAGTSDFFHTCAGANWWAGVPTNIFGFANPFHGNGYVGLYTFHSENTYREYIQAPLNSPMIPNRVYCISFRVMSADNSGGYSNNIGMHISKGAIGQAGSSPMTGFLPQIEETTVIYNESNWVLISDSYTATGGEDYITIGNFRIDANTTTIGRSAYYHIDSVNVNLCVFPPVAAFVASDTSVCADQCITFKENTLEYPTSWEWSFPGGVPAFSSMQQPPDICYAQAGVYPVALIASNSAGQDTAYKTITVISDCFESAFYVPNTFTANGDGLNDTFLPKVLGVQEYNFKVFDRWGQKLFETKDMNTGWDGTYRGRICQQDVYVYKISYIDGVDNKVYSHEGRVTLLR